jgi:hypothetical protein
MPEKIFLQPAQGHYSSSLLDWNSSDFCWKKTEKLGELP